LANSARTLPANTDILVHKTSVALYIDLENLPRDIDFGLLLKGLGDGDPCCIHAVKSAYGAVSHVSSGLRDRLTEYSIRIVDTPHLAGKKNRADLMISVDAFERLHVNVPPIDRYVFLSSDSDFSVIMDRLRSYGKEVWMVCRKNEQHRKILLHSCDKLLFIEDFIPGSGVERRTAEAGDRVVKLLKETLAQIGRDGLPVSLAVVGAKMRSIDVNFTVRGSGFKTLSALVRHAEANHILRMGYDDKGSPQIEDVDDAQLIPSPRGPASPPPARPASTLAARPGKPAEGRRVAEIKLLWPLEEAPLDDGLLPECGKKTIAQGGARPIPPAPR
jgi:hypothetical protein